MEGLKRWYQYVRVEQDGLKQYEPALCIAPKIMRSGKKNAYVITLGAAYKYFMDDAKSIDYMKKACEFIWELFDMGSVLHPRQYARLAMFMQDGLVDLVKMPPKEMENKVVGEVEVTTPEGKHILNLTDDFFVNPDGG